SASWCDRNILIEQSHSVALEDSPSDRGGHRFPLCFMADSGVLAKARAIRMGLHSGHHTDWPDWCGRTEPDSVGTCLAADDASAGCPNLLDPARAAFRRSVVGRPPFGRPAFSKGECRRLES